MIVTTHTDRPLGPTDFAAVDFETYYDDECSVAHLGPWAYTRHPKFYAYLVAIASEDIQYVGPVEDAPWDKITGRIWIAHNAVFDATVFNHLVYHAGKLSADHFPKAWVDSANLAAFLRAPRDLAGAAWALLNVGVDKTKRAGMKGKHWRDLSPEAREGMRDYALNDALKTYELWMRNWQRWPEMEQWLSQHTFEMEFRGVAVNRQAIEDGITKVKRIRWETERDIPWVPGVDDDEPDIDDRGEDVVVASSKKFAEHCRAIGIEPPVSTSAKDTGFQAWLKEHGDKVAFATALIRWRKANKLLRTLETLQRRVRPDGRIPASLKYWGAHTGRWAGGGGFNIQNPTKEPFEGIDLRSILIPGPGKKFCIADLSQIEPRVLAWLAGDRAFLELIATGMSPYEAHARVAMGWTGGRLKDENKALYALAKARVLALGYGAGWRKFITMATGYLVGKDGQLDVPMFDSIFRVEPTAESTQEFLEFLQWCRKLDDLAEWDTLPETDRWVWVNAWLQVQDFRLSNPKITALWQTLGDAMKESRRRDLHMHLPCGYTVSYYDVDYHRDTGWTGCPEQRGRKRVRIYGGKLCENIVQSTARFVFAEGIRRIEEAGYPVVFHVHDEVVTEVDPSVDKRVIEQLLAQTPTWMPGLPVEAEAIDAAHYMK